MREEELLTVRGKVQPTSANLAGCRIDVDHPLVDNRHYQCLAGLDNFPDDHFYR
jgi:hypothetical protein